MTAVYNFYMDDSGTRHPDQQLSLGSSRPDWFAMGGILVSAADEATCRGMHDEFCRTWKLEHPLHSHEIRNMKENFVWLRDLDSAGQPKFFSALEAMLIAMPVMGLACAIDRPGYHRRYHEQYGDGKWSLCRSAFAISIDRASKFARSRQSKLNVFVERSDKKTDKIVSLYFDEIKRSGLPFDPNTSSAYNPLSAIELRDTLYDFKLKDKNSPMMQIADLYLYPMCRGGYNPDYKPYMALDQSQRLIDCHVEDKATLGIKYYCFERGR